LTHRNVGALQLRNLVQIEPMIEISDNERSAAGAALARLRAGIKEKRSLRKRRSAIANLEKAREKWSKMPKKARRRKPVETQGEPTVQASQ